MDDDRSTDGGGASAFAEALGGDVVIEGVSRPGALAFPDALALRDWWDHTRRVPPPAG